MFYMGQEILRHDMLDMLDTTHKLDMRQWPEERRAKTWDTDPFKL